MAYTKRSIPRQYFFKAITSNYLWALEVFKNLSFISQIFSSSQKNNSLKLKPWVNFHEMILLHPGHPNSTRRPKCIKKNFFWDGATNNILFIWLFKQKLSDLIVLHCLQDYYSWPSSENYTGCFILKYAK